MENIWKDTETDKPKEGDKIIFENAVGMYRGIYYNRGTSGVVHICNSKDQILWDEIYRWVLYPSNF